MVLPDILKNSNLSLTLSPSDLESDETLLAIPDPNFRKVRTILSQQINVSTIHKYYLKKAPNKYSQIILNCTSTQEAYDWVAA